MTEKEFLANYDITKYPRPSVTVDIVTFGVTGESERNYRQDEKKALSLLLIKRGGHPFMNKWALPGGFLNIDESIEECAFRELKEETNLVPSSLMPMGAFSEVDRDPRGRIISNAYITIVDEENVKALAGDDAVDALWFKVNLEKASYKGKFFLHLDNDDVKLHIKAELKLSKTRFGQNEYEIIDSDRLAFDHAKIIATAIGLIKKSAEDFDFLFDFMPEFFTLTGLQKVQETILGVEVAPANFRRKITPYVEETDRVVTGAGHRPAKLYRRKKDS